MAPGGSSSASEPTPERHGDMSTSVDSLTTNETNQAKDSRVDEILKTFQAQLDLQQKQLDLIKGLARVEGFREQLETVTEKKMEDPPGDLVFTSDDISRALAWQERQSPISPDIKNSGESFLQLCEGRLNYIGSSIDSQELLSKCRLLLPDSLGERVDAKFYWKRHAFSDMRRFDYEAFGGMSSKEIPIIGKLSQRWSEYCPENAIPFGKLLSIWPGTSFSLEKIAVFLVHLQVQDWQDQVYAQGNPYDAIRPQDMLISFLSPWRERSGKPLYWVGPSKSLFLEMFTIRFFYTSYHLRSSESTPVDGIPISRERGKVWNTRLNKNLHLQEDRIGLLLLSEYGVKYPCFNIVQIGPTIHKSSSTTIKNNAINCGQFAAMHVFLRFLVLALDYACVRWARVMDDLDENIRATIPDLLDAEVRDSLMFDNKDFSRSKLYFTTQQLCRIFMKCVEATIADVEMLREKFSAQWDERQKVVEMEDDMKILNTHWAKGMVEPRIKLEAVLQRIKNKQEEVESLRDGLFNATSVREASRGTEIAESSVLQNQYLFVFTIMTVVYLPLGFVTSIFGMHLFDTTDSGVVAARPQFYATLIVLSLSTYVAAGLAFWFVRNKNKIPPAEDAKLLGKMKEKQDMKIDNEKGQRVQKNVGGILAGLSNGKGRGKGRGKGKEKEGQVLESDDVV